MNPDSTETNFNRVLTFLLSALITAGVVVLLGLIQPPALTAIISLLKLDTVEGVWYMIRAAGLVAYLLLWLSTVWGLAVASKIFDPVLHRAFTFDTHEWLSLLAIGFTVLHVGGLLFDAYLPFSVVQVLVPFTSSFQPLWVGIGVIGMYLTFLVTVTFYLRTKIGQKTFRAIHLLSFAAYAGVTLHSLFTGTDSSLLSTKLVYASSALVVVLLTAYWYVKTRLNPPAKQGGKAAVARRA